MLVRFVDGQPRSTLTSAFLSWLVKGLEEAGLRVLILFWDNASWHVSKEVKQWVRSYNHSAKKNGGLRLLVCRLPKKSPWLNRIEPKWVHGKRAILEPQKVLTPEEIAERLCRYYRCNNQEYLAP